jgi:hypothetical protein
MERFYDESIIFKMNVDDDGNPESKAMTEEQQVDQLKNMVQLTQLPDKLLELRILNADGEDMIQVRDKTKTLDTNEFRVSFNQGLIYFSPQKAGQKVTIKYYARGIELISVNRLFSPNTGTVISIVEVMQECYERLVVIQKKVVEAESDLEVLKVLMEEFETDIRKAEDAMDVIEATHGGILPAYDILVEATEDARTICDSLEQNMEEIVRWQDYNDEVVNVNFPLAETRLDNLTERVAELEEDIIEVQEYDGELINVTFPTVLSDVKALETTVAELTNTVTLNKKELDNLESNVNVLKQHNHDGKYLGIDDTAKNSLKLADSVPSINSIPNTIVKRDSLGRVNIDVNAQSVAFDNTETNIVSTNVNDGLKEVMSHSEALETQVNNRVDNIDALLQQINEDSYVKTYTEGYIPESPIIKTSNDVVTGAMSKVFMRGRTLVNLVNETTWGVDFSEHDRGGTYDSATGIHTFTKNSFTWDTEPVDVMPQESVKPNTRYIIILDVVTIGGTAPCNIWCGTLFENGESTNLRLLEIITTIGRKIYEIDTESNANCFKLKVYPTERADGNSISFKLMVLEKTDNDIDYYNLPYFRGVCGVENPYILNTNKNLFTEASKTIKMEYANVGNHSKLVTYVKLEQGKNYYCRFNYAKSNNSNRDGGYAVVLTNIKPLEHIPRWYVDNGQNGVMTTIATSEIYSDSVNLYFGINDYSHQYLAIYEGIATGTQGDHTAIFSYMYLGEDDIDYIEPKHNKVQCPQKITLRSLPNGTCDTYDPITGEYVQRVGVKRIDANIDWQEAVETNDTHLKVYTPINGMNAQTYTENLYCNYFLPKAFSTPEGTNIYIRDNLDISIPKSIVTYTAPEATAAGFKTWLIRHPFTLFYPLKEIIIKYLPRNTPYVYEGGYIQINSDTFMPKTTIQSPTSTASKVDGVIDSVSAIQSYITNDEESGTFNVYAVSGCNVLRSEGFYNRRGNQVFIRLFVEMSMGESGIIELGGLPFVTFGTLSYYLNGVGTNLTFDSSTMNVVPTVVGSHICFICNQNNNADVYYAPYSMISTKNTEFKISGVYTI